MTNESEKAPSGAAREQPVDTQDLRISDLAETADAAREQEDTLRSGTIRGGAATTSDKDVTDVGWGSPARD